MGHYLGEMPDLDRTVLAGGSDQLWQWAVLTSGVLHKNGGAMRQADLEREASKVLGISIMRMPYVINSAIAENLIVRGGLGMYDHLSLL